MLNFERYCVKLEEEYNDAVRVQQDVIFKQKAQEAYNVCHAAGETEAACLQEKLTDNAAYVECMKSLVSHLSDMHTKIQKEGQRLWEKMLPFARCTEDPGSSVKSLHFSVMEFSNRAAGSEAAYTTLRPTIQVKYWDGSGESSDWSIRSYETGLTEADFAQQEQELRELESWAEKVRWDGNIDSWPLEEFTFSVEVGSLEFKISSTKAEVEYCNGFAAKMSYDWKNNVIETGLGMGYKGSLGVVRGAQVGVETKVYANVVFDLNKRNVTDFYVSAEFKGSVGLWEGGGQITKSFMGKGTQMTAQTKLKFPSGSFEHNSVIIEIE